MPDQQHASRRRILVLDAQMRHRLLLHASERAGRGGQVYAAQVKVTAALCPEPTADPRLRPSPRPARAHPGWRQVAGPLAADLQQIQRELAAGPLGQPFAELCQRIQLPAVGQFAGDLPALALPALTLPRWTAQRLRREGLAVAGVAVRRAALAAALGYMAVRLHDDRLDEAKGSEQDALLLGSALLLRHQQLLVQVAGASQALAVLELSQAAWTRYAEAMALEAHLQKTAAVWTPQLWQASLQRFAPLALAPAALLLAAGRSREIPLLQAAIFDLADAHQLIEDGRDLPEDLAAGRVNWSAQLLGLGPTSPSPAATLLAGGAATLVSAAEPALQRAMQAAERLGDRALVSHLQARRAAGYQWLDALVQGVLARIGLGAEALSRG